MKRTPGSLYQHMFHLYTYLSMFWASRLALAGMQDNDYRNFKTDKPERLGDGAPQLKHFLIVFAIVALLIAFGWISWYKFGWFH